MSRRLLIASLLVALCAGACGSSSKKSSSPTTAAVATTTTVAATTTTTLATSTAIGAVKPAGAIDVVLDAFSYKPDTITAKAGDVTFFMSNREPAAVTDPAYRHNLIIPLVVNGVTEERLAASGDFRPTESGTFTIKALPAGTYQFFCSYHHSQMTGTLTVTP